MDAISGLHPLFLRAYILDFFLTVVISCAAAGVIIFLFEIISGHLRGISVWWSIMRWIIFLPLFGGTLTIALSGPQTMKADILEEELQGKILIAVDDSASSGASDIPENVKKELRMKQRLFPTRLSLCSFALGEGIAGLKGVSVSVVTFTEAVNFRTGDWVNLSERSKSWLTTMLSNLRPLWVGSGTNLARLFLEIKLEFQDEPDLVLLCSDGGRGGTTESEELTLKNVESFSKGKKKIPIYTFGVGGRGMGAQPIPVFDPDGRILGNARDPQSGRDAMTEFDESILVKIAARAGGKYTYVDDISRVKEVLRHAVYEAVKRGTVKVKSAKDADFGYILTSTILFLLLTNGLSWILNIFPKK